MAKYISDKYTSDKSRKNKRYTGSLATFWEYDGDLVGRVAPDRHRIQGLNSLINLLPVFLPHPSSDDGYKSLGWITVDVHWAYNSDPSGVCLLFSCAEDRESRLPDAEEIWKRLAHRFGVTDAKPAITKLLAAEERELAIANIAAKISQRSGVTLKTMTEEAKDIAKDACDYDRRLMLLRAEYEYVFRAEMIRVGNDLHIGKTEDPEGPLVIRWCRQEARTANRGPVDSFPVHRYRPAYDAVIKWLKDNPGMGWNELLASFAGRDNQD
jgi:hypothetical protein